MRSDQINELVTALSKAQLQMNAASRDRKGQHQNSYATLDSIIDAIRKPLGDNGLSFSQLLQQGDTGIMLETFLFHQSGQWLQSEVVVSPVTGNRSVNEMQQLGISITYLKRYALSAILGVSTEEDTDGNEQPQTQQQQQKRASKPEIVKQQNGTTPNSPAALLEVVNKRVLSQYDAVPHLFNAIKQEAGGVFDWPAADDVDGWRNAYKLAKQHADAKVTEAA